MSVITDTNKIMQVLKSNPIRASNLYSADVMKRISQRASGFARRRAQGNVMSRYGQADATDAGMTTIYEPFLNPLIDRQHLEFPKDRVKRNERFWDYFAHDPILNQGIRLLVEFPISNFTLVHEEHELEDFYNETAERLDLLNLLINIGIQYFVIGEAIPFGFVDNPSDPKMWTDFILLNPDWATIHRHPAVRPRSNGTFGKYSIIYEFHRDPALRKIIEIGPQNPSTSDLFAQIPQDIMQSVKQRIPIKLPDVQASYFQRTGNYFTGRGESIIQSCLLEMMYRDKLRECVPPGTEVMTSTGFKKIENVTLNDKVMTFNKDRNEIEYQKPKELVQENFNGNLLHFKNRRVDFTCTPGHRMWVQTTTGTWKEKLAKDVKHTNRVKAASNWVGTYAPATVDMCGNEVPIYTFLEYVGYYLAEGYSQHSKYSNSEIYITAISQKVGTNTYDQMKKCAFDMPFNTHEYINDTKPECVCANFVVHGKDLQKYMEENFGGTCYFKKIPDWIKQLAPEYMEILLKAACKGDGHTRHREVADYDYVRYATVSKQLADDIQEMAWKCGYYATMYEEECDTNIENRPIYKIGWAWEKMTDFGLWLKRGEKQEDGSWNETGDNNQWCVEEPYQGNVYCLVVPNSFFVTRQNGKIAIHGNCQYSVIDRHAAPTEFYMVGEPGQPATGEELEAFDNAMQSIWNGWNKALVWHHALRIQMEGGNGKIMPLIPEYQWIEKRILSAMGLSEAFFYGNGPCHDLETEVLTEKGWKTYDDVVDGEKIAAFDTKTSRLVYETPLKRMKWHYKGDMVHLNTQRIDVCVTPDHECFINRKGVWQKVQAQNVKYHDKMQCHVEWTDGNVVPYKNVLGRQVPMDLWVEFLGYWITEGSIVYKNKEDLKQYNWKGNRGGVHQIRLSQNEGPVLERMKYLFDNMGIKYGLHLQKQSKHSIGNNCYEIIVCSKSFCELIMKEFDGIRKSHDKFIPREYLMMNQNTLQIMYDAMMKGDGSLRMQGKNKNMKYWTYTTVSKQLADDFAELAFKCGKAPKISWDKRIWRVFISEDVDQKHIYPGLNTKGCIGRMPYNNYVWCFQLPSGAFITRRNGKIGQNFNTFANASISLEVLVSRFLTFRQTLENFLLKQIFTPICIWNDLFEEPKKSKPQKYKIRNQSRPLKLPTIKWDKQNLREDREKINLIAQFCQGGILPYEMLWTALNLDRNTVMEKLKKQLEQIPNAPNLLSIKTGGPGQGLPGDATGLPGGAGAGVGMPEAGFGGEIEPSADLMGGIEEGPSEVIPPEAHAEPGLPASI